MKHKSKKITKSYKQKKRKNPAFSKTRIGDISIIPKKLTKLTTETLITKARELNHKIELLYQKLAKESVESERRKIQDKIVDLYNQLYALGARRPKPHKEFIFRVDRYQLDPFYRQLIQNRMRHDSTFQDFVLKALAEKKFLREKMTSQEDWEEYLSKPRSRTLLATEYED